jgi:hypothetical protein
VPIDSTSTVPADPDSVVAALTDEAFLRDWAKALGATVQEIAVTGSGGTRQTVVRLTSPTAGIPPLFARFVGSEVSVRYQQTWTPDADGHRARLDIDTQIFGRAVRVRGDRRLTPVPAGTESTVTGEAEVDAPLIGRQAEGAVRELVAVVLRREEEVLRRRFPGP